MAAKSYHILTHIITALASIHTFCIPMISYPSTWESRIHTATGIIYNKAPTEASVECIIRRKLIFRCSLANRAYGGHFCFISGGVEGEEEEL